MYKKTINIGQLGIRAKYSVDKEIFNCALKKVNIIYCEKDCETKSLIQILFSIHKKNILKTSPDNTLDEQVTIDNLKFKVFVFDDTTSDFSFYEDGTFQQLLFFSNACKQSFIICNDLYSVNTIYKKLLHLDSLLLKITREEHRNIIKLFALERESISIIKNKIKFLTQALLNNGLKNSEKQYIIDCFLPNLKDMIKINFLKTL